MLTILQKPQYLRLLDSYKAGNRFNVGTPEYRSVLMLESLDQNWTRSTRLSNGIDVPTLTYVEFAPSPKPEGEIPTKSENVFSFSTTLEPKPLNIGLPPGTTPDITKETTTTETTTTESFVSKYKMPLIIGAVAIGYFFLKKK
jgi:hypothetical protein